MGSEQKTHMEYIEDLRAKLVEDGFNFEPILDDNWHKIKDPIRGRYATKKYPNGIVMTVLGWNGEYKKVYKCFDNGHINGSSQEVEAFIQTQIEETKAIKLLANEKAAIEAQKMWLNDTITEESLIAPPPYCERKGLGMKLFGARVDSYTGCTLYVPCIDISGIMWGIQRIFASGDKTFIKGQKKEGTFHLIGEVKEKLYIAEGYATGVSVHLATKQAVAVSFDAGNLKKVAKLFREKYPTLPIIIAGDNDEKFTGQQAAESAAKEVGGTFTCPNTVGKDWNDCLVEKGLPFLTDIFQKVEKTTPQPTQKRLDFHIQPFDEILTLDMKPPTWLIDAFLPEVGISALFGKPKAGKSTLARDLMVSVAEGQGFLGRDVKAGKVIYLAMEENLSHLREQLVKRGLTKDNPASKNILIHASSFLPINPLERLDQILNEIPDVKLVILDTLFKIVRSKDEHAYQENMGLLEKLAQLSQKYNIHIMGIHHAKKGDHADGDAALGSTAITGAFDANIFLRTDEKRTRIISSQHRYGEPFDKTILTFDKTQYRFTVSGSVDEVNDKEKRAQIWAFLRNAGMGMSATDIAREVGMRRPNIVFILEKDVRDGFVKTTGIGNKASPKLYCLSENLIKKDAKF